MKILKPGKVEVGKFVCPTCTCEFIATEGEVEWVSSTTVCVYCPQSGCRERFRAGWDPYEEPTPTQSEWERLVELLYGDGRDEDLRDTADRLIAHGVTFREAP